MSGGGGERDPFGELRARRIERLWEEGHAFLENREYERALGVAAKLERERHSGAFDLAAQAHVKLGNLPEAIAVLERGVQLAPEAWLNWQLLGNCRSDADEFDAAATAYAPLLRADENAGDSRYQVE